MSNLKNKNQQLTKAILSIRNKTLEASRKWFQTNDFIEVQAPTLIPALGQNPGSFTVDYYDKKAYLNQGLQPYAHSFLEYFKKIYTIAPTFRVEKQNSKRHLTEYWRIETATLFQNFNDLLHDQERLIQSIIKTVTENLTAELEILNQTPERFNQISSSFPRITYNQAIDLLQKKKIDIHWGQPLTREMEKILSLNFNMPFFITHFPVGFETLLYTADPKNKDLTLTADLIAPGGHGEVASAGEFISVRKSIRKKLNQAKIHSDNQKWCLSLIKDLKSPISAFTIGVERLLCWICNLEDIKQTTPFPRTYRRVYP